MTRNWTVSNLQVPPLLVVEDSNEDFEALQRSLGRSPLTIPIQRCVNGEQALAYWFEVTTPPSRIED